PRARYAFAKYGRSRRCKNGRGGPWANDVYRVIGKCRNRATNGFCCVFPFVYRGRRYNSCARTRRGRPWCAIVPDYKRGKRWGYCRGGRTPPIRINGVRSEWFP
ncbi:PREDICTED: matrix metalloproteinase-9-like, partial [Acropora digitifera]|uniref:matrix metalloproteinase-9-like n=1 Tax=Acropora digitifera TaxID=70779 RepID=UPI00077A0BA7